MFSCCLVFFQGGFTALKLKGGNPSVEVVKSKAELKGWGLIKEMREG